MFNGSHEEKTVMISIKEYLYITTYKENIMSLVNFLNNTYFIIFTYM